MKVTALNITLRAVWLHTLKEKRSEIKRLIAGLRNKFHVSVIECGSQDDHKSLELGIAYAANEAGNADSIRESIISYLEQNTDAEIVDIRRERWQF